MRELPEHIWALDYAAGALYIAAGDLQKSEDGVRYSLYNSRLAKYDLNTGEVTILADAEFSAVSSIKVWDDKLLVAGHEMVGNDERRWRQAYIALVELETGKVFHKYVVDESNCYECVAYDIVQIGENRFAVSFPGMHRVMFFEVWDRLNILRPDGEANGLRDAKGLCYREGMLYVGGSTRVNHETRGAVYTVDVDSKQTKLYMTVMEPRGALNSLWISSRFLVATNFYNAKLFTNSFFIFDLFEQKLLLEVKGLPMATMKVCYGDDALFSTDLNGKRIMRLKFDLAALKSMRDI